MARGELIGPSGKGAGSPRGRSSKDEGGGSRKAGSSAGVGNNVCTLCGYSEPRKPGPTIKLLKCPHCGGTMIQRI